MDSSKTIDPSHLVVVTSQSGEKYVGNVPEDVVDAFSYMEEEDCIELDDARCLIGQVRVSEQKASGTSVSSFSLIVPIDVASSAIPRLWIRPSSWYFPHVDPDIYKKIIDLIALCQKNESIARARNAGIVVQ
jgi:hypothetical protein